MARGRAYETGTDESDGDIKEQQERVQGEVGKGKVRDEKDPTRLSGFEACFTSRPDTEFFWLGFYHTYIYTYVDLSTNSLHSNLNFKVRSKISR